MASGPSAGAQALLRQIGGQSAAGGVYLKPDGSVDGTATQTWNLGASAGGLQVSSNAGIVADYRFMTDGVERWIWRKNGDAESGANAGSNLELLSRNDDGTINLISASVNRATGKWDFLVTPSVAGVDLGTGGGSGGPVTSSVSQTAHGFAVGTPVKLTSTGWVAADADAETTMCDAMVSAVADANNFTVTEIGQVALTEAQWDARTGETALSDPYFLTNVSVLLHGNGANGGVVFTDSAPTPKTFTAFGNVQTSTASIKYGSASIKFDGAGDYLRCPAHADINFGTGDFTIEFWLNPTSLAAAFDVVAHRNSADNNNFWLVRVETTGYVRVYNKVSGVVTCDITSTSLPMVVGTFKHCRIKRVSGVVSIDVDGVTTSLSTTANASTTWAYPSAYNWYIGVGDNTGSSNFLNGYLDDFRITKGLARTGAAPTAELPDASTTGLGLTKGEYYWLSTTAGFITKTQPTSGFAQCLGVAESATVLRFAKGPVVAVTTDLSGLPAGAQIGYARTTSTTPASTTDTSIPLDATIPQNTEGVAYPSLDTTITPKAANSLLEIEVTIPFVSMSGGSGHIRMALFRDGVASALATDLVTITAATAVWPIIIKAVDVAGSTAATTFKVRWCANGNTGELMQAAGVNYFGASNIASMIVREIKQ